MTRKPITASHNYCETLYPSSEQVPSIEMDKFQRRYREWLLTDELQAGRRVQHHLSWSLETEVTIYGVAGSKADKSSLQHTKASIQSNKNWQSPSLKQSLVITITTRLGASSSFTSSTTELPAARAQQEAPRRGSEEPVLPANAQRPTHYTSIQRGELPPLHMCTIFVHNTWY